MGRSLLPVLREHFQWVSVGTSLHSFEAAKKVKNLKLFFQDV